MTEITYDMCSQFIKQARHLGHLVLPNGLELYHESTYEELEDEGYIFDWDFEFILWEETGTSWHWKQIGTARDLFEDANNWESVKQRINEEQTEER